MILDGVIDTHVHTAPDVVPRSLDDHALARRAVEQGYAGVVLKHHLEPTTGRAALASHHGVPVHGGVCLNLHATGGINPAAVEANLRSGAAFIWMPTFTADNPAARSAASERLGSERGRVAATTADGELTVETVEVLQLVAEADVVLATGHLRADEIAAVVTGAVTHSVGRVLIQHPESASARLEVQDQRELLERHSGLLFERCLRSATAEVTTSHPVPEAQLVAILAAIAAVGVGTTVLATDYGLADAADPVTAMEAYLAGLHEVGLSLHDLRRMACVNPRRLVER